MVLAKQESGLVLYSYLLSVNVWIGSVFVLHIVDIVDLVTSQMRRWKADPGVKNFKGSCLVTFPDASGAEKFLALADVKCEEAELVRKWKNDWSLEKEEEVKARRERNKLAKNERRNKNKGEEKPVARSPPKKRKFDEDGEEQTDEPDVKKKKNEDGSGDGSGAEAGADTTEGEGEEEDDAEEEEDEAGLYPGSVFKLTGIPKEGVHVKEIRAALSKYDSSAVDVAFVAWSSGQEEAVVRLKERDAAKKVSSCSLHTFRRFQIPYRHLTFDKNCEFFYSSP